MAASNGLIYGENILLQLIVEVILLLDRTVEREIDLTVMAN